MFTLCGYPRGGMLRRRMFSERTPPQGARKESTDTDVALEKRFRDAVARFEKNGTTGDETLDELVSDYIGYVSFNEAAGTMGLGLEEEHQKELTKEHLKKTLS
jgi:hypothetical protein